MGDTTNNELARILGRIEGKLEEQTNATRRVEAAVTAMEAKLSGRLDQHEDRLRALEIANPTELAEAVKDHEQRLQALEKGAAKAGIISGIGASLGMAVLLEVAKSKLGL